MADTAGIDAETAAQTPPPAAAGTGEHTSASSASNGFNLALQFWTQLDLPGLQKKLDSQGLEITAAQKDALVSRKTLATKTKDLRKLPDDQKLDQLKPLLKLYQNEIDDLTNKRKKIESYFFDFYRSIAEAPDPRPLLELSLDAVVQSGDIAKYKAEIDALNEELARKADYNQLKQRLLHNEQASAELLSSKLKAKDDEYKALIEEKENNWKQKEILLQRQLDDYKNKIEELRTSNEVTELQLSSQNQQLGSNDHTLTVLAELDIVSRDAESSKRRLLEVEKRNEDLRRQLTISNSNSELESVKSEFAKKVSELEGENALLIAELSQCRKSIEQLTAAADSSLDSHKREVSQLSVEIKALKEKLAKTSDYEDIKQELHFLRQIEFDDEGDDSNSEERGDDDSTKTKIDSMLIHKNKTLNAELANYRSQHDELHSKVQALEAQLQKSNEQITKLHNLNVKLEEDLSKFDDTSRISDNMSLISGFTRKTSVSEDASSILPIITKQRDRFKKRSAELEEDLKKQFNVVSDLRRQLTHMKKDNEELYERTRFLASSYNANNSRSRNQFQPKANADLERNAYRDSYESKLHPIEQFRIKEQERISSRLSPIERIFISLTRAILATRFTRMVFFFYCLGLHCIVMLTAIYSTSLNAHSLPEVGINQSTGGVTNE